ncbi:MAG: endonuclease/exonuclease/phosphatase family protein [Fibrobacterota bacterium]|nr:endonuclease/exonuclease/phosphatase family protein [Fibrobacterota bacterium]
MKWYLPISITGLALVTWLPVLRVHNRWIRMMEFPRLQLAAWGVLNLAFAAVGRGRPKSRIAWSLLNAACILHHARNIYPFTFLKGVETPSTPVPADSGDTVKLLIYNVLMTNRNVAELIRMVEKEDPDLILLNEPDHWWIDQLAVLESSHAWQVKVPQENTYGIALYSRLPLSRTRVDRRREEDVPSIHAVVELPSGKSIRILAVHPKPPAEEDTEERDAELDEVAKEIRKSDLPCIVAGDMNDVAWSRTTKKFQQLSGTLDPRVGRGFYNTFHARIPVLRYSLDHVFHSQDFTLVELRRLQKLDSDHFPILIQLRLRPDTGSALLEGQA